MTTALERSRSADPSTRYEGVLALPGEPSAEAAEHVVALLVDETEVCVDEGMPAYDVDPTYRPVSFAARQVLPQLGAFVWPAIAAAWPTASAAHREACVGALASLPLDARLALPDEAHALLVERARAGAAREQALWERAFATRIRGGELADEEQRLRAIREQHPYALERERALLRLAPVVTDPVAFARELFSLLSAPHPDVGRDMVAAALVRLPPLMPASLVEQMASSDAVRALPVVWAWLARHGAPAAALVSTCVDALEPERIDGVLVSIPTMLLDRRWRLAADALLAFGPIAEVARPVLLARLLQLDEMPSLQGSLRFRLIAVLGDVARINDEIGPQIDALAASSDPPTAERGRALRRALAARA